VRLVLPAWSAGYTPKEQALPGQRRAWRFVRRRDRYDLRGEQDLREQLESLATNGAASLGWLAVCHQPSAGAVVAPPTPAWCNILEGLEHYTRSRVVSGLAAGSYKVGLCMLVFSDYGTWYDADNIRKGQTTALVFN